MFNFKEVEDEVQKFWKENTIYEKVKKKNEKGPKFYFLQGPPYTSGKIHIGHAWNNSLKDMILRYKRMKGFNVWDRAGYDMHGLPTENAVQKKLGLKSKEEIEEYGVDKFVKACLDFAIEHAEYMNEDFWKLGVWLDHENAYMPVKKEFISGEWAFFKKAWEQKRLYKGKKVMHWDAESETSLAKHELEYETVKDTSVFLKFKKKNTENEYFIIWTTTPWTIPYNLAIMVNPELDYVKIKVEGEYWIVAKALVGAFMNSVVEKKFEVVDEFKGTELEGQEYEHFMKDDVDEAYDVLKEDWKNVHTVILNKEYVDTSAGTGLVHCAPGCGPEDQEAAAKYDIGAFNTLDERGRLEEVGKYTGWIAKEEDKKFIKEFDEKGVLVAKSIVEHEYPHSWRSHKPVVFRTTEQWFLRTEDVSPELLKYNEKVNWVPKKSGESYARWAENLKDNSVTRQRYWGCPVPIWQNVEDPEDYIVIGSAEELENEIGKELGDDELHKPIVDGFKIEKDGKTYERIPDVADVWIDSGTASWNCLYNDPELIKKYFPADLVLEGTEQTRLWFSLLQICSNVMFGKGCYENVFVHGMMLDFQGTKMSKSIGNVISPYEVIDKYSVDILRNFICQVTAGENINFSWEDVKVKQRNLIMLSNISNYILDLESRDIPKGEKGIEESWILSKFNNTIKEVTDLFENYKLDETISKIENLYITLSRDYIKYVREKAEANSAVLETLKEIYVGILKMLSTVCPHISESLWGKMEQKEESVHLCSWPEFDDKMIDNDLEKRFSKAMEIIEAGLRERDRSGTGLRWPLSKATAKGSAELPEEISEIVKAQLNVKSLEFEEKEGELEVSLDLEMTPELEAEGYSRELARKIQAERKTAGLQKGEMIEIRVYTDPELGKMFEAHLDFLKERTNASKMTINDDSEDKGDIVFTVKEKQITVGFS